MRQVLVEDGYSYLPRPPRQPQGVFDHLGFRDFQAEASKWISFACFNNFFIKLINHHYLGWREAAGYSQDEDGELDPVRSAEKRKTLEELFRPPLDLMFTGSMEAVSLK